MSSINFDTVQSATEIWFDKLIAQIKADQITLEVGVASKEKREMYKTLMSGQIDEIAALSRETTAKYFIERVLTDFIHELYARETKFKTIAVNFSKSELLVWIEIQEDDDLAEKSIYLAEAKVNAFYKKYEFHISTTVVEDCDQLEVPSHYRLLKTQ